MSVLITIIPLSKEFQNESEQQWLNDNDIKMPNGYVLGHNPTFNEIRIALESIPSMLVEYEINKSSWRAYATKNNHHVTFDSPFAGSENNVYTGGIYGSIMLAEEIIQELTGLCGSLIMLIDGESPTLFAAINPSDSL